MAMDILLDEANETGRVDVFDVVRHLRQQRMNCVQTEVTVRRFVDVDCPVQRLRIG